MAGRRREAGITEFYATTLWENRRMLGVFRDAGFETKSVVGGGEAHVRFPVTATDALARAIACREHQAEARSVGRILAPGSIAVVGAGQRRGAIGHEVFRNLLLNGFDGPVYPVNPKAAHVAAVRAYPSVLDDVELAVICVSSNDLLQYWEDDPATDVVLLYLESFGNPGKFSRIARRVSGHKPIVAVKSGRSRAGSRGASSHAAALASPDLAVDALFRQTGVIRVDTMEQLFDTAEVLAHQPLPPGRRVAIVGNSGGPGVLAADACDAAGLEVPEVSPATQEALRGCLPAAAGVRNPVDAMAAASAATYEQALRVVLADSEVDAVIVVFTPTLVTRLDDVARAIATVTAEPWGKPVVANLVGIEGIPDALRTDGAEGGGRMPSFPFPETAARALARAAWYAEWRRRPPERCPNWKGSTSAPPVAG